MFFLPSYSPEMNPDVYLNNALKHDVHAGLKPCTADQLNSKTQSFMRRLQHKPDDVRAFFRHKHLSYLLNDIQLPGNNALNERKAEFLTEKYFPIFKRLQRVEDAFDDRGFDGGPFAFYHI